MNSIKRLIVEHGGTLKVARNCELPAQTVSNWITRESIPVRHWKKLFDIGITQDELVNAHLSDSREEAGTAA